MSEWIWQNFERLVVIDTETTGIDPARERVIELAAIAYGRSGEEESFDLFVSLPEGRRVPPFIVRLTGITDELLAHEGVKAAEAAERLAGMLSGPGTLLAAYNAQFDLCFIYYLLKEAGHGGRAAGAEVPRRAHHIPRQTAVSAQARERGRGLRPRRAEHAPGGR